MNLDHTITVIVEYAWRSKGSPAWNVMDSIEDLRDDLQLYVSDEPLYNTTAIEVGFRSSFGKPPLEPPSWRVIAEVALPDQEEL